MGLICTERERERGHPGRIYRTVRIIIYSLPLCLFTFCCANFSRVQQRPPCFVLLLLLFCFVIPKSFHEEKKTIDSSSDQRSSCPTRVRFLLEISKEVPGRATDPGRRIIEARADIYDGQFFSCSFSLPFSFCASTTNSRLIFSE